MKVVAVFFWPCSIIGLMSFRREYDICIISLSSRVMYLMVACRWFLPPSVIPKKFG